jgi:protein SERAC1
MKLSCHHISDSEEESFALEGQKESPQGSHWPRDFLPRDCSEARILVWGYDSRVSKGYCGSNKSNIFAHAKDLLYSLRRDKPPRRPVIFVAHSLGGILVKEVG